MLQLHVPLLVKAEVISECLDILFHFIFVLCALCYFGGLFIICLGLKSFLLFEL